MAFRHDILRGVRLGGFALVVLLAILLVRRMVPFTGLMHFTGPAQSTAPRPAPPAKVHDRSHDTARVPAPVRGPDPPLPPLGGRTSASRSTPVRTMTSGTAVAPAASKPDNERSEAPEAGGAAAVLNQDAPSGVEPTAQSGPTAAGGAPVDDVYAPQAPANRGKRAIKAVGRFLHLGGKKQ
jgi:hypothetical protein